MIILDGERMDTRVALHAELKARLDLPDYYGGSLDALNDCLSERVGRELVVIRRFSDFAEGLGLYALKTLRVFSDNGWQILLD